MSADPFRALAVMALKWRGYADEMRSAAARANAQGDVKRANPLAARAEALESCARELERWIENE